MRRCGRTGLIPVGAVEEGGQGCWQPAAGSDFHQGADKDAHHVAQETVCLDFKDQFAALTLPGAMGDVTVKIIRRWILFAKSAEGVGSRKKPGRLQEGIEIKAAVYAPDPGAIEGGFCGANAVAVALARGAVTGVEVRRSFLDLEHGNIGRQQAVESTQNAFRRLIGPGVEMSYLARGVNSGVGAARSCGADGFAHKDLQGPCQFALDGTVLRLNLPAREVGAVVFEEQANIALF